MIGKCNLTAASCIEKLMQRRFELEVDFKIKSILIGKTNNQKRDALPIPGPMGFVIKRSNTDWRRDIEICGHIFFQ